MEATFPHQYIAIEGNIGAGKTTLCKMVAEEFNCRLILEQFTDNPFLPFFYKHPERYAFPVELFFMTERHKQLQEELSQGELFSNLILSDYYFIKTLLFARSNLSDEEFRLFQRLFSILNTTFKKPDLLVYLHRPVENLVDNIQHRGRSMEQEIPVDYLQKIQKAYFDYFKNEDQLPIVILDLGDQKFWEDQVLYRKIVDVLKSEFKPGVHQLEFK